MNTAELQQQLAKAQETVRLLQKELAETNRGLVALTMELEQRVDERTAELRAAHEELKKTNSELMQLTLELEDRVTQRTADLKAANETLEQARIAALNLMEDAIVARDETEQLNAELEQRVIERTAQLQSANKELEAFSYSVSHDLRAPLRGISGFASILVEDYAKHLDEEGRRTVGVICAEAKRMGQLIDDLLAFSRLGRQSIQVAEVDMGALAQEVFNECAASAGPQAPVQTPSAAASARRPRLAAPCVDQPHFQRHQIQPSQGRG